MSDLAPVLAHLRHADDLAWEETPLGLTAPETEHAHAEEGAYWLATTMGADLFVCLYVADDADDPLLVDAAPCPAAPFRQAALIRRLMRGMGQ